MIYIYRTTNITGRRFIKYDDETEGKQASDNLHELFKGKPTIDKRDRENFLPRLKHYEEKGSITKLGEAETLEELKMQVIEYLI